MKIVHISESLYGGVSIYIKALASRIIAEHYFIFSNKMHDEDFLALGKVYKVNMKHNISITDIRTILTIRNIIKSINPDIIYCHSTKAGFLGRMANNIKNIPFVYNPHGWAFDMNVSKTKVILYRTMEKILSKKYNKSNELLFKNLIRE